MIRILHTIDTTGPGGAETVFVNLVKGLDRQKFEPIVAIRGPGWVCDELGKNGISPLFVNSKGAFNYNYLRKLIGIIRKYNIDIVHSHLLGSNVYCSLAGLICGVPVVSTFHGFVDIDTKERFLAIKSMIINLGSARLVFVSDRLKAFYVEQKGFSAVKSVTIYNGIDTCLFKPQRDDSIRNKLGLGLGNVLVGAVGNIRPFKGYEYLLKAAKLVVDRFPLFRFAVVGEGSGKLFNDLLDSRKRLGLESHFHFLAFEPDVPKFLNNLDIFILPSISEGFSISTIEAMACGVPVIVTYSGGPEEIVENGLNGIMVPVRDPYSLANAIISSVEDFDNNEKQIRAFDKCNNIFSINKTIIQYEKLYQQISKRYEKKEVNIKKNNRVWITWETQRRSIELAKTLKCKLYLFTSSGFLRYPRNIINTFKVMRDDSTHTIFVQNPSMILATVVCLYKFISKKKVIVDRHSTFFLDSTNRYSIKSIIFRALHKFTIKNADLTIVTNKYLANIVENMDGNAFVLPDKLPEIIQTKNYDVDGQFNILLISSFGEDEPIEEVFMAMGKINIKNLKLYVSGNYNKLAKAKMLNVPSNVVFTGYLEEEDYMNLLYSVDAIMVLTTEDYCMLCGCYESVSVCKPIITSNKSVLQDYFKGSIFVDNNCENIINGIYDLVDNYERYKENVIKLRFILADNWRRKFGELETLLKS